MTIVVSFISNFKPQLMHGISRFLVVPEGVVAIGVDVEVVAVTVGVEPGTVVDVG